jgi:hypothetical protein
MIQSGDGDWIINLIPLETESRAFLVALRHRNSAYWKDRDLFVWRVPPRQTKKIVSLCPLCLRGEKSIWDKIDIRK